MSNVLRNGRSSGLHMLAQLDIIGTGSVSRVQRTTDWSRLKVLYEALNGPEKSIERILESLEGILDEFEQALYSFAWNCNRDSGFFLNDPRASLNKIKAALRALNRAGKIVGE